MCRCVPVLVCRCVLDLDNNSFDCKWIFICPRPCQFKYRQVTNPSDHSNVCMQAHRFRAKKLNGVVGVTERLH